MLIAPICSPVVIREKIIALVNEGRRQVIDHTLEVMRQQIENEREANIQYAATLRKVQTYIKYFNATIART